MPDPVVSAAEAHPASRGTPRALALCIVAAMALLAMVESGTSVLGPARAPSGADWEAAAADVRARFRPGDLIVFAPAWADPVGRLHLGDLIPPEMAARADSARYGRIFEVSLRGARAPETREPGVYPEGPASRHGRLKVALYSRSGAAPPLFDFTSRAAEARVTQMGAAGAEERPCLPGAPGAFRCATTQVEPRILEVEFAPRRGILVPSDGALVTRLEWTDVPLGNSIVGYTGMHDWHSRKNGSGPVDFRLFIDGAELLATRQGNADGWKRFVVETLRFAGTRHTVRVEVGSPPGAVERRLGFHAETRGEAPPAPEPPVAGAAR